jgi:hypothetical protein
MLNGCRAALPVAPSDLVRDAASMSTEGPVIGAFVSVSGDEARSKAGSGDAASVCRRRTDVRPRNVGSLT